MAPVVGRGTKCCGSMPRCRTCPVRLAADIRATLPDGTRTPEHLAGIPPCLHKYEPLFRGPAPAAPERV
jgi:hypothetical protein